jgi:hypothetical protein
MPCNIAHPFEACKLAVMQRRRPAEAPLVRRATRFTSREAPSDIANLVEQATARLGGRTERTEFE